MEYESWLISGHNSPPVVPVLSQFNPPQSTSYIPPPSIYIFINLLSIYAKDFHVIFISSGFLTKGWLR